MKVVAVLGSPHAEGPSSVIAREVLRGARDAGHEVVEYVINDMNLKGCQACGTCKAQKIDCVIQDDLAPYWKDLHECGALVVAAPNYCSQVSGPMITYMNRHYCLITAEGVRVHPGIKLVGVFSQGAKDHYEAAEKAYDWFLRDFQNRDMVLHAKLVHTGSDPWDEGSEIRKQAYRAGRSL